MFKSPCIDICEFKITSGLCKGTNVQGLKYSIGLILMNQKKKILLKLKSRNIPINIVSTDHI